MKEKKISLPLSCPVELDSKATCKLIVDFIKLEATPSVCLSYSKAKPAEQNLSLSITLESENDSINYMDIDGVELKEGVEFFQHQGKIFFRPKKRIMERVRGKVKTSEGKVGLFYLTGALSLEEEVSSIAAQLENASELSKAVIDKAKSEGKEQIELDILGDTLKSNIFHWKIRTFDFIERELFSNDDFLYFHNEKKKFC